MDTMSNQYYIPPPGHGQHPAVMIQQYDHSYPYSYTSQPLPNAGYTFGAIHDPAPPPTNYYPGNPNIQFHESSVFPVPLPVLPILPPTQDAEPEAPTRSSKRHHYSKEQNEYLHARFSEGTHPTRERKMEISSAIGITLTQTSTWFTNRSVLISHRMLMPYELTRNVN